MTDVPAPRVLLHDEIAEILRESGRDWMTTQEIADQVNARGRYRKKDGSDVTDFQIHGRTRKRPAMFDRDGSRVQLRSARSTLTFNLLLAAARFDPAETRLLRHKDRNHHREVYDAALAGDLTFERYQETQGNPKVIQQVGTARYLASFVADPMSKETVFVGLWERVGERAAAWPSSALPASMPVGPEAMAFETRRLDALSEYRGRLVIDWGDGERAWVQRADRQDKAILELKKERTDPPFPGFLDLKAGIDQVGAFPRIWAEALRSVRGVYLLVHRASGDQYVGSAVGEDGFLGRWLGYADGHGGNVGMRELAAEASAYEVSILEVAGSAATIEDVYARESAWKEKLGTRAKGLNRN